MTTTYTKRVKNILQYFRGLITTDDASRVLVGENEDLVLIWTADSTGYTQRTKNTASYTQRTKN